MENEEIPTRKRSSTVLSQVLQLNKDDDIVAINERPTGVRLAQQMTIAGSFLDFALFVADVEHLKFILDSKKEDIKYYMLLIIMLSLSLILQLVVVFLMFIISFKKPKNNTTHTVELRKADGRSCSPEDLNNPQSGCTLELKQNVPVDVPRIQEKISILNHTVICLVTVIAILNVFITVFGDRSTAHLHQEFSEFKRHHNLTIKT